MPLHRLSTPPDAELLKLHRRRTELDRAIRLLEEIRLIRMKRPPELANLISRAVQRVA
jgi:hypothetical protein